MTQKLLPTEQKARLALAIKKFRETGELTICEPCNCGEQIRHDNGGNYHGIVEIRRDGKTYVRIYSTCELVETPEWEYCKNPYHLISEYADWL